MSLSLILRAGLASSRAPVLRCTRKPRAGVVLSPFPWRWCQHGSARRQDWPGATRWRSVDLVRDDGSECHRVECATGARRSPSQRLRCASCLEFRDDDRRTNRQRLLHRRSSRGIVRRRTKAADSSRGSRVWGHPERNLDSSALTRRASMRPAPRAEVNSGQIAASTPMHCRRCPSRACVTASLLSIALFGCAVRTGPSDQIKWSLREHATDRNRFRLFKCRRWGSAA